MASQSQQGKWILYLHELLFSLNLAPVCVVFAFGFWGSLSGRFYWIERLILLKLHRIQLIPRSDGTGYMQYPDFTSGYVAFWIPAALLALCVWALLRVSSRTRITREILRSVAGFAALFLLPGLWVLEKLPMAQYHSWVPLELFRWGAPIELTVAVFCAFRYLKGKWPITALPSVVLLVLHFTYWFYHSYPFPYTAWLIPYIVGLSSGLVWGAYLRSLRQDDRLVNLPA